MTFPVHLSLASFIISTMVLFIHSLPTGMELDWTYYGGYCFHELAGLTQTFQKLPRYLSKDWVLYKRSLMFLVIILLWNRRLRSKNHLFRDPFTTTYSHNFGQKYILQLPFVCVVLSQPSLFNDVLFEESTVQYERMQNVWKRTTELFRRRSLAVIASPLFIVFYDFYPFSKSNFCFKA